MIFNKVRLGDYIEIKHGFAFDGDGITDSSVGNPILVTPGNFNIGGGFKADKCKYYSGNYPEQYALCAGDIIVTMTDLSVSGDTLGYSAIVPSGSIYLHNQRIGKVIIKNNSVDPGYLYYLLRTKEYHHYVVSTSSGTAIHHTSPDRIMDYQFNIPDLHSQKCIASILNSIELKISINKEINDNLGGTFFAS